MRELRVTHAERLGTCVTRVAWRGKLTSDRASVLRSQGSHLAVSVKNGYAGHPLLQVQVGGADEPAVSYFHEKTFPEPIISHHA